MRVLIVGSGGREHALAWKAAQSPRLTRLYVAPGNAGTAAIADNVPIPIDDTPRLAAFANEQRIDLIVIGPEAPLASGLSDALRAAGHKVFGPSRAAAEIEASKAFAKAFMVQHGIPTARYAAFGDYQAAAQHLSAVSYPVVIKASGLAAGKGVVLPDLAADAQAALRAILVGQEFGAAGAEVLIEERLTGHEVSLLAFTDGGSIRLMPPAQDHKRLLDGDRGPNTGGMGAYAPAPVCPPELAEELGRTIIQRTVDSLRAEGCPFVGVLYAGLMLTPAGPRVLEFNCRFGDPEAQAILPLLESDLLDVAEACATGRLSGMEVRWKSGAAACVVLASEGYPGATPAGREIRGLEQPPMDAVVFHAGTRAAGDRVVTAGGRVLGVTGWGSSLAEALSAAYRAAGKISFDGMQLRRDIGGDFKLTDAYAASGVDIGLGNRAVDLMRAAVASTYGPDVLAGLGAFGGLFDASALKGMDAPVLVASTDGVGTKVKVAAQAEAQRPGQRSYESIGHDIVNHCINDILVQGAQPLFFLDYIASSRLEPERVAAVVRGMAAACREAGCALLGGETAEMPGVYAPGEFDVAGTIVGVAERARLLPRGDVRAGDVLVGLRSSGPHTNGFSLIRKAFADVPLDVVLAELDRPLAEVLLAPHRSYLPVLSPLIKRDRSPIKALIHITGGGFVENIPRVLPDGLGARLRPGSWPVPPVFQLIQQRGRVSAEEMYRVFNMGLGMLIITGSEAAADLQRALGEESWLVGEVTSGPAGVTLA